MDASLQKHEFVFSQGKQKEEKLYTIIEWGLQAHLNAPKKRNYVKYLFALQETTTLLLTLEIKNLKLSCDRQLKTDKAC